MHRRPRPSRPALPAWCAWGLFMMGLWLTLPTLAQAPAQQVLRQAWLSSVTAPSANPPTEAAAWQAVALPVQLPQPGLHWLAITLPPAEPGTPAPAILLPAAGPLLQVRIHGQSIGVQGLTPPPLWRQGQTPTLYRWPAALWQPEQPQQLLIQVMGSASLAAGLSEVVVGPEATLRERWRVLAWQQEAATLITGALGIVLGLYVLLRWAPGTDRHEFAWFGIVFIIWGSRTLHLGLSQIPMDEAARRLTDDLAGLWAAVLFALFALRLSRSEDAAYRPRFITEPLFWGCGLVLSAWLLGPRPALLAPWLQRAAIIPLAMMVWGQWRMLRLATRVNRFEIWLPVVLMLLYVSLAVYQYQLAPQRHALAIHLARQYESAPLFLSAGWLLARRYWLALRQAHTLADSLQTQVDAQRRELETHYAQRRDAEQEHARTQERSRVLRDLHDGLGLHLVSALKQARSGRIEPATLSDTLQDGLDELRVAIDSLDTSQRDPLTLLGTLRFRMSPRFAALGLTLGWQVDPALAELDQLSPSQALQLLRVVQEALGNALKHSGASNVVIALDALGTGCRIRVQDNGRGFAPEAVRAGKGLSHLAARARAMGATACRVGPRADGQAGAEWVIELPGAGA